MAYYHAGLFPIDIPVFQTTGYPKKSDPLFLNYLPNAPYWQHNPFRVYLSQKANISFKARGRACFISASLILIRFSPLGFDHMAG